MQLETNKHANKPININLKKIRFTGHETFPCRYAWLPKAFIAIEKDSRIFTNEEDAMVALGVGKNMMKAIRFWVQAAGVAETSKEGGYAVTDFGKALLSESGHDPFLEDIRTLWLIHWQFSTHVESPIFAWDYMLNNWQYPEISAAEALRVFQEEASRLERTLSPVTLAQHFDIFLHTYVPRRSHKGEIQEDNLDSPLVELELIQQTGERKLDDSGKRETIYAFRREEKPEITAELFIYCLNEFWNKRHANEKTLNFRDVSIAHGSPGQIFKLPEWSIRERLEAIETDSNGAFSYQESASLQRVTRSNFEHRDFLSEIYTMMDINS